MRIQLLIPPLLEGGEKAGVDARRILGEASFLGRNVFDRGDGFFFESHLLEGLQRLEEALFSGNDLHSAFAPSYPMAIRSSIFSDFFYIK